MNEILEPITFFLAHLTLLVFVSTGLLTLGGY